MSGMHESRFLGYIGPRDLHDGRVREVQQGPGSVTVHITGAAGGSFSVEFSGVSELMAVQATDMVLYALCEMSAPAPEQQPEQQSEQQRRFVFANGDDDDPARLEILAKDFQIVEQRPRHPT